MIWGYPYFRKPPNLQVNIVNRPRIVETSVVQKWAVDFGCTLFIIGSALLAAISGLDLLEDMLTCGVLARLSPGVLGMPFLPVAKNWDGISMYIHVYQCI